MMRPDTKVEKVYRYPKPVDIRKSIDGLAALAELDIKVAVFDPVLFVFLTTPLAVRRRYRCACSPTIAQYSCWLPPRRRNCRLDPPATPSRALILHICCNAAIFDKCMTSPRFG